MCARPSLGRTGCCLQPSKAASRDRQLPWPKAKLVVCLLKDLLLQIVMIGVETEPDEQTFGWSRSGHLHVLVVVIFRRAAAAYLEAPGEERALFVSASSTYCEGAHSKEARALAGERRRRIANMCARWLSERARPQSAQKCVDQIWRSKRRCFEEAAQQRQQQQ